MAPPPKPLPYGPKHKSAEDYTSSLLAFITESSLHQALCGGVHILDFLTRDPDLYASLIPQEWRAWFSDIDIYNILDLLLREDTEAFSNGQTTWRGQSLPPQTLLDYIVRVRDLTLDRSFVEPPNHPVEKLERHLAVGMSYKKEHEVSHFASFVSNLTEDCAAAPGSTGGHAISHLVDFGSGQNYLGRVLAGPKYAKNVVALESRSTNIEQARKMDVHAKMAKKKIVWRTKKSQMQNSTDQTGENPQTVQKSYQDLAVVDDPTENVSMVKQKAHKHSSGNKVSDEVEKRITYIEHVIQDGSLDDVVDQIQAKQQNPESHPKDTEIELLVMSLHSCGNLVHHGLRSLLLNPSVKAVAMIGCCYNLCTERLGPPTYKLPTLHLRSANQRLTETTLTCDPHGFPMSQHFLQFPQVKEPGIRFNITARMMAVQAPMNWTREECEGFFTRHFYRALIQRIFLDTGFINPPIAADEVIGGSIRGWAGGTAPIIIGSLTKSCYKSFVTYVRGAARKICIINPDQGELLVKCFANLSDQNIADYERKYIHKRRELCIVWSLMSFSAQLVECAIVCDRLQFLKEQPEVGAAWVQTVFEYQQSPRNLAIIGLKK